jgi:hypothetical protein
MPDPKDNRAAEIQDSIRQILYHDWDPIGIAGAAPQDEYDAYIARVYRILVGSRSEEEIAETLFQIERDIIGMPCDSSKQLLPVARKLLQVDVRL